jgi:hypothetical protein
VGSCALLKGLALAVGRLDGAKIESRSLAVTVLM